MNEIQLFNYNNNEIRVIERDGEPWFVAKDVCDVLELTNITEALRGLDDDELTSEMLKSGGQNMKMQVIEYVRIDWPRIEGYLRDFRKDVSESEQRPEFITENIFYRLAMRFCQVKCVKEIFMLHCLVAQSIAHRNSSKLSSSFEAALSICGLLVLLLATLLSAHFHHC